MSRTYMNAAREPRAVGICRLIPANNGDWRVIDCAGSVVAVLSFRRAVLRAIRETSRAFAIN